MLAKSILYRVLIRQLQLHPSLLAETLQLRAVARKHRSTRGGPGRLGKMALGRVACTIVGVALVVATQSASVGWTQRQSLSSGSTAQQWREAQLELFERQLADPAAPPELRAELEAQRRWLSTWNPPASARAPTLAEGPSGLFDTPAGELSATAGEPDAARALSPPVATAARAQGKSEREAATQHAAMEEPVLDPEGTAEELRLRLFSTRERVTASDTAALQAALKRGPGDLGLRQLQMQWVDQVSYRDEYWKEVSDACSRVIALIDGLPPTEQLNQAAAFAYYRKARALAHCLRGVPIRKATIAGAANVTDVERQQMRDTIDHCGRQVESLVGPGRSEFFQLEMFMLRDAGWTGRALELLDRQTHVLRPASYLTARRELLLDLGWTFPANDASAALAKLSLSQPTLGSDSKASSQPESKSDVTSALNGRAAAELDQGQDFEIYYIAPNPTVSK